MLVMDMVHINGQMVISFKVNGLKANSVVVEHITTAVEMYLKVHG
jgi:hypothetical protein